MSGRGYALAALGGIFGALGVLLAAQAAHGPWAEGAAGGGLSTASDMLLFHAGPLIGLGALAAHRPKSAGALSLAAAVLAVGLTLFAGQLCIRAFYDTALFPLAAPVGGVLMIVGWAGVALAALAAAADRRPPLI